MSGSSDSAAMSAFSPPSIGARLLARAAVGLVEAHALALGGLAEGRDHLRVGLLGRGVGDQRQLLAPLAAARRLGGLSRRSRSPRRRASASEGEWPGTACESMWDSPTSFIDFARGREGSRTLAKVVGYMGFRAGLRGCRPDGARPRSWTPPRRRPEQERAPLIVREPARGLPRLAGPRIRRASRPSGSARATPTSPTSCAAATRAWCCAARPGRPFPPPPTTCCARRGSSPPSRARGPDAADPGHLRRRVGARRALLRDGGGAGPRDHAARSPTRSTSEERPGAIGDELVDALVEVHAVDWRAAGLEGFAKPTGYLERQLRRFNGLWEHNKTRELPRVAQVGDWLASNLPESPAGHDRARRLPARQRDGGPRLPRAGGGGLRLGAGHDRRPARRRRLPDRHLGRPRRPRGHDVQQPVRGHPRARLPLARGDGGPLRGAQRAHDAALHWYQTLALWKAAVFMEGNYKALRRGRHRRRVPGDVRRGRAARWRRRRGRWRRPA